MVINNLLNSVLMVHDLGEEGYGIPAKARNFDLSRIFTQDQIEYSVGLRTAKNNKWIEVVGERPDNYLKDIQITEEVRVITEKVIDKSLKRKKILEQIIEEPMVIVENKEDIKLEEIKEAKENKEIEKVKEIEIEVEKVDETKIVEKTEEPKKVENEVIDNVETDKKELESLSWNELRGVAKEKGINLRQKRKAILKQLRGEVI